MVSHDSVFVARVPAHSRLLGLAALQLPRGGHSCGGSGPARLGSFPADCVSPGGDRPCPRRADTRATSCPTEYSLGDRYAGGSDGQAKPCISCRSRKAPKPTYARQYTGCVHQGRIAFHVGFRQSRPECQPGYRSVWFHGRRYRRQSRSCRALVTDALILHSTSATRSCGSCCNSARISASSTRQPDFRSNCTGDSS